MNPRSHIDIAELRRILKYYPESGLFEWLEPGPGRTGLPFAGTKLYKTRPYLMVNGERLIINYQPQKDMDAPRECSGLYISVRKRLYPAHALAWAITYGKWACVSHLRDKTDNRLSNLTLHYLGSPAHTAALNAAIQEDALVYLDRKAETSRSKAERLAKAIAYVKAHLDYDPVNGLFSWRNREFERWSNGTPVKAGKERAVFFMLEGRKTSMPSAKAAALIQTGSYPEKPVKFLDGNHHNLRWRNLCSEYI